MRASHVSDASCLLVVGLLAAASFVLADSQETESSSGSSSRSASQQWKGSESSGHSRTFTNSQVLAFNVSNFVAVMFLKALLVTLGLATGFSGFGLYTARRTDPHDFTLQYHPRPPPPSQATHEPQDHGHIRWATTYLTALNTGDYRCLKRIACEQPERAQFYASLKDTIVATLRMVPWMFSQNPDHDKITAAVRSAARIGTRYHQLCRRKFPCRSISSRR
ncbi:hypothetical protein HPB50_022335 [Hyalomma asiaticum]|uniref:Uncharacterized protein n=1 Tax=Hyalomma asiaticum TaxID=266040 RepID=A0ACB7RYC9_HYAAI|nr:hypothetical protein HPB50_022335 [Hyalomma asiaticum]